MKTKHALLILVIGFTIGFIASLLKILHMPGASIMLFIAGIIQIIGGVLFVYKLLTYPKIKDFLNS